VLSSRPGCDFGDRGGAGGVVRRRVCRGVGRDRCCAVAVRGPSDRPDHRSARYISSSWGYLVVNPRTGRTLARLGSDRRLYVPASSSKLWAISAAWNILGPDSRVTTPVYAVGRRSGGTLTGDLALVGKGDLTLDGRTKPDGTIDFRNLDHAVANVAPGVQLTPEDPLAGLNRLARQVRALGYHNRRRQRHRR
jgi:D-Ala-D-Ala carboxypeptidase 3 (S13) family